jgi:Kef-type K+ transport system membrane component KefB
MIIPKASMGIIYAVSQVGLVLYMFLIGVEFEVGLIRQRLRSAAAVSLSGILAPFILGGALALFMAGDPTFFTPGVLGWEAVLFMGSAMSITAFPMLARIIHERGLTGSPLGTLALTAGAIDDAAAWCILAIVLASFGKGWGGAYLAIGGGAAFAAFMFLFGRHWLRKLANHVLPDQPLSATMLAVVLAIFCLSAWAMDAIGIHAVFGGFILGACMPKGALTEKLRGTLQPFVVVFLLPMFFTFSGLKTQLGVIVQPQILLAAITILLASFCGKGIACWAAARVTGEDNRNAMAIGSLMNARGLMELILINIGLQAGIIEPGLFSILVLMAIVTTLMATPLFNWIMRRHEARGAVAEQT